MKTRESRVGGQDSTVLDIHLSTASGMHTFAVAHVVCCVLGARSDAYLAFYVQYKYCTMNSVDSLQPDSGPLWTLDSGVTL